MLYKAIKAQEGSHMQMHDESDCTDGALPELLPVLQADPGMAIEVHNHMADSP